MSDPILICTDLDRTLLPNGAQAESPGARARFGKLAVRPDVRVAYVSGRDRTLVLQAIEKYRIPFPDYVIGDVGTSIFSVRKQHWELWQSWHQEIGKSWRGMQPEQLAELFDGIELLRLQEPAKQNRYKLSYYAPHDIDPEPLLARMQQRLGENAVEASLVWSVDETAPMGLLDVLPARATKRHALEFLMQAEGFSLDNTVYAGDSGNDLPILTSPIRSVLVANATPQVRNLALHMAKEQGNEDALYLARGGLLGMNGNYSAGVLEGAAHYLPQIAQWLLATPVTHHD